MKKFSDLGITTDINSFTGDKIKISKILNIPIIVHDFKIEKSKHNTGDCLYLQISIEKEKRVVFTGSTVLIDTIKKVPKEEFPFQTTIIKQTEYFEFT